VNHTIEELEEKAYQYRKRFLELFTTIGFGHVTSAYSWAEVATVLYNEIMDLAPEIDKTPEYDKIVISKGHGSGILFPIFEDVGYFSVEQMNNIVKIGGSNTELRKLFYPGFDFYGGSLGIGLGVAAGLAKAAKVSDFDWKTYCIVGDAENYEGSIWEAINFAGHQKLDNLIVVVDRNGLGCSDFTEHMLAIEPLREKWESFNWEVTEINGHNIQEVYDALLKAKTEMNGKPKCIIAKTKKGQGLNYLIDKPLMHGYMPKGEDINKAFESLK
jgi:transketolase